MVNNIKLCKNKLHEMPNGGKCQDCYRAKSRREYLKNRENYRAISRTYYLARREHRLAWQKDYQKNNRDRVKVYGLAWQRANPQKVSQASRMYLLAKKRATPPWLTDSHREQMSQKKFCVNSLTAATGVKFEIDHIIPLRAKNACGLNVPWNLRVITATQNKRKKNQIIESGHA